jgi:AICAR transformylase/IMP cyclohydrolase PurH
MVQDIRRIQPELQALGFCETDSFADVCIEAPATRSEDGIDAHCWNNLIRIVCALNGQTVGVGAGQQSRIDCTRIACHKADVWRLRQHPTLRSLRFKSGIKQQDRINWRIRLAEGTLDATERAELQGILEENVPDALNESEKRAWLKSFPPISLASDGYLPFPDNIREAERHDVGFIAHPGGSTRDELVTSACRDLGIALVTTGVRAFHH